MCLNSDNTFRQPILLLDEIGDSNLSPMTLWLPILNKFSGSISFMLTEISDEERLILKYLSD